MFAGIIHWARLFALLISWKTLNLGIYVEGGTLVQPTGTPFLRFLRQSDGSNVSSIDIYDDIYKQTISDGVEPSSKSMTVEIKISKKEMKVGDNTRVVILVNDVLGGDPVYMKQGDTLNIKVINNMDVPTSLHCHGIHFIDNHSWYDGAAMVSECGVPPNGGEQTYVIKPSPNQAGTFFCHSHQNGQYLDGFRFPLIIEGEEIISKYKIEKENQYVANVCDWHYKDYETLFEEFLNPHNPEGIEPTPETPLVNGQINDTKNFINCRAGVDNVLLRIVNSSGLAQFFVIIDGHKFSVIELDGIPVQPKETNVIVLGAAQRAGIMIPCNAADKSKNYKVRFVYDLTMFDTPPEGVMEATMSLTYNDGLENPYFKNDLLIDQDFKDRSELVQFYNQQGEDFANITDELKFEPVEKIAAYTGNNEKIIRLMVDFIVLDDYANHGTFNDIAFYHPKVPTIYSMVTLDHDSYANSVAYGTYTNTYVSEYDDIITIVLHNLDAGDHPFHLHGHSFQVLKNVPIDSKGDELDDLDTENPIRTDTVVVKSLYYAVLRFKTNNPGTWMFHCHVQWHLDSGLGMIFVSLPSPSSGVSHPNKVFSPPPKEMLRNCKILNIMTTGNAVGNTGIDLRNEEIKPKKLPYVVMRTSGYIGIMMDTLAFIVGVGVIIWYCFFTQK